MIIRLVCFWFTAAPRSSNLNALKTID